HRPQARGRHPSPGRQRPAGERGVELRQGTVGFHLRHPAGPAGHPAGAGPRWLAAACLVGGGDLGGRGRPGRCPRPGRGAHQGLAKLRGTLLAAPPGAETEVLNRLAAEMGTDATEAAAGRALTADGAVILAGERLAETPGALSALARLTSASGASLAWVPRRA